MNASVGAGDGAAEKRVYLVRGSDATVVGQATASLITTVVGDRDPTLVVEEHGGSAVDEFDVGAVVDAVTTPPFLVDLRVVVVRDVGKLTNADGGRLAAVLETPLPTNIVVLVASGGTVPPALVKAVKAAGTVVEATVGTGRDRIRWLDQHVKDGPVRLSPAASRRLGEHLGDDVGRLAGVLGTLAAAYGEGAAISEDELVPYLGEAGPVPPWELTDAIDSGSTASALSTLHRMLGPGGRAAPAILAVLHSHFSDILRLDGADVTSGEEAAEVAGIRSPFVAKKALAQSRRLGSDRVAQAIMLLATADFEVKGGSAMPPELVLEILVARLSRLVRTRSAPGRRRARTP
ncbi:MAG: DNA polymerase III subunit delta [Acidimicrobiales bacterium]